MYKGIIFDLDGTLLDSLTDLALAGNYALSRLGFPVHSIDDYKYLVGNGIPKLIERMLPQPVREEDVAEITPIFNEYYDLHKGDNTKPYEGILPLLKECKNRGILMGVCTNKANLFAVELVESYFPSTFDKVVGVGGDFKPKPAPEMAESIVKAFQLEKSEILYVGDTNVDMETGINAGLPTCGVLWGFRPEKELAPYNPTHIISHPKEILDFC